MANFEQRETKNKGTVIRVTIRLKGFPAQRKTFKRMTDARMWARQTEASIERGEYKNIRKTSTIITLQETIDRYRDDVMPHKATSTQRAQKSYLDYWAKELGEFGLAYIDTNLITKKMRVLEYSGDMRRAKITKPKSPRTLKLYRDCLSQIFKYAILWGQIGENPIEQMPTIKKSSPARTRFLDESEIEALLEECKASANPWLYLIVIFALSTGARKSEILKLKVTDVELSRHRAIFRDTKNGETRSVPIVKHLAKLLKKHLLTIDTLYESRAVNNGLVFPNTIGDKAIDIRSAWELARKKANINNFRFHDLRHTAASYLAMNEATSIELSVILGHKTLQMVKRYAHLSTDHTQSIVEKMNEKMFD